MASINNIYNCDLYKETIAARKYYKPILAAQNKVPLEILQELYQRSLFSGRIQGDCSEIGIKILGSASIRYESGKDLRFNFRVFSNNAGEKGAILKLENQYWNILANDVIMLAAIRDGHDFYIVTNQKKDEMPTLPDEILWSEENQRLRVAGREIAQIMAAGYRCVNHPITGLVLVCEHKERAESMTLLSLCEAAEKTSLAEVTEFLANAHIV